MGFLNWFKRKKIVAKKAVPATASTSNKTATKKAAGNVTATGKATHKATKAATTNATADARPQCVALTAAGDQCRNSARQSSKYCGRHKGYQPKTAAKTAGAKDTKPAYKGARDTAPATRKATNGSSQVTHGSYKLYKSGNRYFFSKKTQAEAKKTGATPVRSMPSGRTIVETPNGLPVLKKN